MRNVAESPLSAQDNNAVLFFVKVVHQAWSLAHHIRCDPFIQIDK